MADKDKKEEDVDDEEVSADEVDEEEDETKEGDDDGKDDEEAEDKENDDKQEEPPAPKRAPQTKYHDFELPKRITKDQLDMTIKPSNAQKYLPKPKRVIIPFVIPWESTKAKETQAGMGAFGQQRNPFTKVDQGSKQMQQGELNSESILTLFAGSNAFASQRGERGFGAHRKNVVKPVCTRELDNSRIHEGEGVIPKQAGNLAAPTQSGETPIGAIRAQVPRVKYKAEMTATCDAESDTFVSRQMRPNELNHAGTSVIDTRRNQVPDPMAVGRHSRKTEGMVPRLLDVSKIDPPTGTGAGSSGLGAFRQVFTPTKGGYDLTSEDVTNSKKVVPWINQPRQASQRGSGGFNKTRDVVNPLKYHLAKDKKAPIQHC